MHADRLHGTSIYFSNQVAPRRTAACSIRAFGGIAFLIRVRPLFLSRQSAPARLSTRKFVPSGIARARRIDPTIGLASPRLCASAVKNAVLVGVFVGSRWDSHWMRWPARMLGYFSPLRRRGAEDSVGGQVWDLSPQPRRKPHGLDLCRDFGGGFAHRAEQAFVVCL